MTEKMIQLIIHHLQAYKVVTSDSEETKKEGISSVNVKEQKKDNEEKKEGKDEKKEEENPNIELLTDSFLENSIGMSETKEYIPLSFTLNQKHENSFTQPYNEGLQWRDNYRGMTDLWKNHQFVLMILPFKLILHYDENQVWTLSTLLTRSHPLHFIISLTADIDLFYIVMNDYGCNMMNNVWLLMESESDEMEEVAIGSESDESFRCPAYPPPSLPSEEYVQQMEFKTEGLQLTLSEEEPQNVNFGRSLLLSFTFFLFFPSFFI